jgi:putative hemolysin
MSPDIFGELLLVAFLISLNAFFAAAEVAIISVRKTRLRQMLDEGVAAARLIHDLAENSSRLLGTIQVGVMLAAFFTAATSAETIVHALSGELRALPIPLLADHALPLSLVLVTVLLALVMLILGELVPKNLALQHSERVAILVAQPLTVIATLFAPVVSLISAVADRLVRLLGGRQSSTMPFVTEDEIKTLVDAGEETGVLEEGEKKMIYGVFGLSDTTVRQVMVPRVDMALVNVDISVRQAASLVAQSGHSRLPVFEETPDRIVGVLHVKELLAALAAETPTHGVRALMSVPYFVPESKPVADLLREMQKMSVHMAIVVDEYGGTAGLVTIEDLLEEIVGEIHDEHDQEESQVERLDDDTMIFNGRVTLDQVNEMLDLNLTGENVDTIGGYVAARLEKVPARGDRLDMPEATIEVLAAAGRRAKRVQVTRKQQPASDGESAPSS